jgi:hypothetical protein
VAFRGEIQWPPTGSFAWPPSDESPTVAAEGRSDMTQRSRTWSALNEVAEAVAAASESEPIVYVERLGDVYRWSLATKGGDTSEWHGDPVRGPVQVRRSRQVGGVKAFGGDHAHSGSTEDSLRRSGRRFQVN